MTLKTILVACLLLVFVAPFVGCDSKPSTASVVGTWVIDTTKTKAAMRDAAKAAGGGDDKMRDEMLKGMESMIDSMASSFHVTFAADGTFSGAAPMGPAPKGKWTLDTATGILTATPDEGGEAIKAKLVGNELHALEDGKTAMVMVKGTPKAK